MHGSLADTEPGPHTRNCRKCRYREWETVICRGQESHTSGPMVQIGVDAPDFQATNAEMKEVSLSSFKGKRVILNIFPSLDTPTCAMSVRQFNARASELENTVVLCISMDLPFAQSRFCTVEGLENVFRYLFSAVMTLYRDMVFSLLTVR